MLPRDTTGVEMAGIRIAWKRYLLKDRLKLHVFSKQSIASVHNLSRRQKATTTAIGVNDEIWEPLQNKNDCPSFRKIDLSFENAKEAYKSKKNYELLRSLLVFNLCGIDSLVKHNKTLMKLSRKVLGKKMFKWVMKATFYGQFVAGEDNIRIRPTIERNISYGVKSILDYSVEKDLSSEEAKQAEMKSCVPEAVPSELNPKSPGMKYRAHEEFGDRRDAVFAARTYFYEDEAHCDENMRFILQEIDAVSGATNATGFAAIKLTALGRPQLLLQLSEVLVRIRQFYDLLAQSTNGTGSITKKEFNSHFKSFNVGRKDRQKWFTLLDREGDGEIDLMDWNNLLEENLSLAKVMRVPNLEAGILEPLVKLSPGEEEQMKNMLHRIDKIIRYGMLKDVRIMVDAEQTYFQVAINRLVMELMRKYNKKKALVFNTYQCYLKDIYRTMATDLDLARKEDFYFGAKLVRGAYMDQERKRALKLGYEDPINKDFEATTVMYEKCIEECMKQMKERPKGRIAVMIATHNEDTVRFTVQKMNEYNIKAEDRVICFGQLLGMCDQVSFSLGQAGYSVYKYVPYGPVEEVLPYLSRRALENRGFIAKVEKEKKLMWQELFRRFKSGEWLYKLPPADAPHMKFPPAQSSSSTTP